MHQHPGCQRWRLTIPPRRRSSRAWPEGCARGDAHMCTLRQQGSDQTGLGTPSCARPVRSDTTPPDDMCVCTWHMYKFMYMSHVYASLYMCMYMYTSMGLYMCKRTRTCTYVCTCARPYTCASSYVQAHVSLCVFSDARACQRACVDGSANDRSDRRRPVPPCHLACRVVARRLTGTLRLGRVR